MCRPSSAPIGPGKSSAGRWRSSFSATAATAGCAARSMKKPMLRRVITSLLLLAFGLPGLLFGGPLYFLVADFYLVLAAWEYGGMSQAGALRASPPTVMGG